MNKIRNILFFTIIRFLIVLVVIYMPILTKANAIMEKDSLYNELKLAKQNDNKVKTGKLNYEIANYYLKNFEYENALRYFDQALVLREKTDFGIKKAKILLSISYCTRIIGKIEQTLEYNFKALSLFEEDKDQEGIAQALKDIGSAYFYYAQYDNSLEYYKRSYKIYSSLKNQQGIANTINNIGMIYKFMGQLDLALKYYLESVEIKKEINDMRGVANTYNNIGKLYAENENYEKALEYYSQSIEIARLQEDKFKVANCLNSISESFLALNQTKKALEAVNSSIIISADISARFLLLESYELLYKINVEDNDMENALKHLKLFKDLQDSVFSEESKKKLITFKTKIENERKEKEIKRQEKQIQLAEIERQITLRNLYLTMGILFAILLIILLYRIKAGKEINRKLRDKNKQLVENSAILNQEKEKAEISDKMKSSFLSNMSHEIRNPMNTIVGFSNLLLNKNISPAQRKEYISTIVESGQNLLVLVNDIIDISRVEAEQQELTKEYVNINPILSDIYQMFEREKYRRGFDRVNLVLKKEVNDESLYIKTDPEKFRTVIKNLLKNAFRHTREGYIEFGYTIPAPDTIQFYVQDTGLGFSKEAQKRIFERFSNTEEMESKIYEGTGLGLIISRKIVNLLGGEIYIESILGKGSTFYFTLPFDLGPKPELKPVIRKNGSRENYNWNNKLILVAEDEPANYRFLETILRLTGVSILWAQNGADAVSMIERNAMIDLVLMDVKMPVLNGYEATKQIRKINNEIPIIAQTAYAMGQDREKSIEAGCNDYVSKPINADDLLELINQYI